MSDTPQPSGRVLAGLATVSVQVERLKHTVLGCLDTHAEDLQATIRHYTEAAVREFNFGEAVGRVAREAIADTVRSLVREAVAKALRESEAFQRFITEAVMQAVERETQR